MFQASKHSLKYLGPKLWSNLSGGKERLASNLKAFNLQIRRRDLSSFYKMDVCAAIYVILSLRKYKQITLNKLFMYVVL